MDEKILRTIEDYDSLYQVDEEAEKAVEQSFAAERPKTAGRNSSAFAPEIFGKDGEPSFYPDEHFKNLFSTPRPFTAVARNQRPPVPALLTNAPQKPKPGQPVPEGRIVKIEILSSWGDMFYAGMTGLEILDQNMKEIPIDPSQIFANPRDMNSIPGHSGDYRTLEK